MLEHYEEKLSNLRRDGFDKREAIISSPQGREIAVTVDGQSRTLLNMCSNNYLGLANDPGLVAAAKSAIDQFGFGMASVRFICGTQELHSKLESHISDFLGTEDTILYSSCFDANTGLFETLFGPDDTLVSDELNHASIIDGIRLCKAERRRYKHNDMESLEAALKASPLSGSRAIVTDGVFSMDGTVANLPAICALAEKYNALVIVDDSHAVGIVGEKGKGTPSLHGVSDKVHILTGTLGKALGGASGGYVSGRSAVVEWLRQASRPYLFSNSLMPAICAASIKAITLASESDALRENLNARVSQLRTGALRLGLAVGGVNHPIVPIIVGDADHARMLAKSLLADDVYAVAFSYPVVAKGAARVRMQVSAQHTREDIDRVLTVLRRFQESRVSQQNLTV
ncbi:glycine C-acetyltransferase [Rhizobium hainanense]|uniref:5-aminolevulinate synthase n=1 Tax=Rhizobium hainanense TaxID=52131 RepID=A0A1C3WBV2_9HYPH|nr:glycine C-acetyltransferase [Rhizobium hainanense]SCB37617.1 2-amino-3-ketobutyrate coenzyme A ligase [Rhizobium hainanense]